jgi:hypothetical protein
MRSHGYLSIAAVLSTIGCSIVGMVLWGSSIPTSECAVASISPEEQDVIQAVVRFISIPLVVGAVLGLVAGAIGLYGGFTKREGTAVCAVTAQSLVAGLAVLCLIIACVWSLSSTVVFDELCDNYQCGQQLECAGAFIPPASGIPNGTQLPTSGIPSAFIPPASGIPEIIFPDLSLGFCADPDVCCNCVSGVVVTTCKDSRDWACDMRTKKTVALIFAAVSALVLLVASAVGCGAACCCASKFTEAENPTTVVGEVVGRKSVEGNVV